MEESVFWTKYSEFMRKGLFERTKWMESISRHIPSNIKSRIRHGDKTVLAEIVLPEWMNWEMIYSWASEKQATENAENCVLCNSANPTGIKYRDKFVCEQCFKELYGQMEKQ